MNIKQVEENSSNIHFDETMIFVARLQCLLAVALTSC